MKPDLYILDDYISLDDIRDTVADTRDLKGDFEIPDWLTIETEEIDYAQSIESQTCSIRRIGVN